MQRGIRDEELPIIVPDTGCRRQSVRAHAYFKSNSRSEMKSMVKTRADVRSAWNLILPYVRHTPVIGLEAGALGLGNPLTLKLEMLQHSGTFKGRGAFHKLLASRPLPAAGVVAASGGNHGAAVAYAARALGVRAEIFVPTITSPAKLERLRSYGADVRQVGAVYGEARHASEVRAAETGALQVYAYDDPDVFVGAGTVGLELAEQTTVDSLLVAVGGGGLIAGCALAIGENVKIVSVETDGTPTLNAALAAGKPVDVAISGLAADSLGATRIGTPNFAIAQKLVRDSVLVNDDDIRRAQKLLWQELRLVCEPAGAAGLAALLAGAYRPAPGERVGLLLCGANCDPGSVA